MRSRALTTLDSYSDVTATMQAAEAMGRLLGGQDDNSPTDEGCGVRPQDELWRSIEELG